MFNTSTVAFVSNNIINPFLGTLFSIVGGVIPLGFLLYIYSKKEKRKLLKIAQYRRERIIPELEKHERRCQQQLNEFVATIGDFNTILNKDLAENKNREAIELFLDLEKDLTKVNLDIIKEKSSIRFAEQYNFWIVISDFLKRKYFGEK